MGPIYVHDFLHNTHRVVQPDLEAPAARTRGHGGADFFLVNSFTKVKWCRKYLPYLFKGSCGNYTSWVLYFSPPLRFLAGPRDNKIKAIRALNGRKLI